MAASYSDMSYTNVDHVNFACAKMQETNLEYVDFRTVNLLNVENILKKI